MTDQIKAIENLILANKQCTARTPYLDVAAGALVTAKHNVELHLAETQKQIEARRLKVVADQKALAELQGQVEADKAPAVAATATPAAAPVAGIAKSK